MASLEISREFTHLCLLSFFLYFPTSHVPGIVPTDKLLVSQVFAMGSVSRLYKRFLEIFDVKHIMYYREHKQIKKVFTVKTFIYIGLWLDTRTLVL